jgi:hypothetical protein
MKIARIFQTSFWNDFFFLTTFFWNFFVKVERIFRRISFQATFLRENWTSFWNVVGEARKSRFFRPNFFSYKRKDGNRNWRILTELNYFLFTYPSFLMYFLYETLRLWDFETLRLWDCETLRLLWQRDCTVLLSQKRLKIYEKKTFSRLRW